MAGEKIDVTLHDGDVLINFTLSESHVTCHSGLDVNGSSLTPLRDFHSYLARGQQLSLSTPTTKAFLTQVRLCSNLKWGF